MQVQSAQKCQFLFFLLDKPKRGQIAMPQTKLQVCYRMHFEQKVLFTSALSFESSHGEKLVQTSKVYSVAAEKKMLTDLYATLTTRHSKG